MHAGGHLVVVQLGDGAVGLCDLQDGANIGGHEPWLPVEHDGANVLVLKGDFAAQGDGGGGHGGMGPWARGCGDCRQSSVWVIGPSHLQLPQAHLCGHLTPPCRNPPRAR